MENEIRPGVDRSRHSKRVEYAPWVHGANASLTWETYGLSYLDVTDLCYLEERIYSVERW